MFDCQSEGKGNGPFTVPFQREGETAIRRQSALPDRPDDRYLLLWGINHRSNRNNKSNETKNGTNN